MTEITIYFHKDLERLKEGRFTTKIEGVWSINPTIPTTIATTTINPGKLVDFQQ